MRRHPWWLVLCLCACRRESPASVTVDAAATVDVVDASAEDAGAARTAGPLASATSAERVAHVADFALGGHFASLPELATDPGEPFDTKLRDKVAPKENATQIRYRTMTVGEGLPKEIVHRVIRSKFARLRDCYATASASKPDLHGELTVTFRIDGSGAAGDARVTPPGLQDEPLHRCVEQSFSQLLFPKPEGGKPLSASYTVFMGRPD